MQSSKVFFPGHKRARGFSFLLNFKESTSVCTDINEVIANELKRAVLNTASFVFGNSAKSFYELPAPILQERGGSK